MKIHAESETTEKEKTSKMKIDVDIASSEVIMVADGMIQGLMKQLLSSGTMFSGSGCFSPESMKERINNLQRPNPEEMRKDTEKNNADLT